VARFVERPLCQTQSGGVAVIASSPHYAPVALLTKPHDCTGSRM